MNTRSRQRILIVDDEPDIRELLEITLGRMKLDTRSAKNLSEAQSLLAAEAFDLCLTDMRLPDGTGLELVKHIQQRYSQLPVAMITAYGSLEVAIDALKAGAFDFLTKPVDLARLRELVGSALRLSPGTTPGATVERVLLGDSPPMRGVRKQIEKLARSQAPVYISGESGCGKELVARLIHEQGPRASQPFVPVNCGAIPTELMESEFFGHRKGSFSGAIEDKPGLFQAAHGGTLFLDEVADLPLAMQVKLLRAIQERRVRKIGATAEEPVDVRIISATHKNLAQCVEQGSFRQDLFYRLNVIELGLPPLRERLDDLGLLTGAILERLGTFEHRAALGEGVLDALRGYSFPGNVRELENILERALAFANDGVIEVADLALKGARVAETAQVAEVSEVSEKAPVPSPQPSAVAAEPLPASLPDYLNQVERDIILRALTQTQFNRTQAAQLLGISFRQLRYQMQKLNIQEPEA